MVYLSEQVERYCEKEERRRSNLLYKQLDASIQSADCFVEPPHNNDRSKDFFGTGFRIFTASSLRRISFIGKPMWSKLSELGFVGLMGLLGNEIQEPFSYSNYAMGAI